MRRTLLCEVLVSLAILVCLAWIIVPGPCEATVYKYFAAIRIGSGAPKTSALNLASGTAATAGIAFGSDVSLYRSASAQLANSAGMYVYGDTTLGHAATHTTTIAGDTTIGGTLGTTGKTTCTGDLDSNANTALGNASTDTITCTGRLILRTLGSDPLDGTPGNRPAGSVNEIGVYSGVVYLCTNASTPLWVRVGPPAA